VTPAAWSARAVNRLRRVLVQRGWEALVVAGGFAVYGVYALSRHAQYLTAGYDLGIFDQAVRAYSHFQAPIAPLKGIGFSVLGDHFHPIIALLAPLYWVWDDPRTLLLAQAALFALSAIPVMRFAERRFSRAGAVAIGAAYLASWPLQAAVDFDFHEIAFAVALLAVLIDALDRRAIRTVVLACLALLLVREDMGVIVAMAGVLLVVRGRTADASSRGLVGIRDPRWVGAALGVTGVVVFWLATSVFIPAFAPSGTFAYWDYSALGHDLPSAIRYGLTRPWSVAKLLVTPSVKAHTLFMLFMPALFTALASPYLLLALPVLAERMLNSRSQVWLVQFHYSAVTAPILAMAAIDGISRVAALVGRGRRQDPGETTVRSGPRWLVCGWIAWLIGTVVIGTAMYPATFPLNRLITGAAFERTSRPRQIADVLTHLPLGVCVEADDRIAPHLTKRWLVTLPTRSDGLATWEVIDLNQVTSGWQAPAPAIAFADAEALGFRQVLREGPIILMTRDGAVDPRCTVR